MDIDKIHKEFTNYVNTFDMNDKNISLKYYHTLEVADISYKIASEMGLSGEDKDLAKLIGYIHDIGRFEQIVKTNTFKDKEMDHADNGVKLLFDEGLIRKFIDDDKYDDIIRKAVRNHNKYKIIEDVDEREKLFTNIIRDSDKIDIFRVRRLYHEDKIELAPSEEVIKCFEKQESVKLEYIKNKSDSILCVLAFIFDFNYDSSLKILKETGYYEKLIDSIKVSAENKKVFEIVKEIVLKKLEI